MNNSFRAVNVLSHLASMTFAFIGVYYYFAGDVALAELTPIVIVILVFSLFFWPLLELAKHFTFKNAIKNDVYNIVASFVFVILSIAATGLGISYYNSSISETYKSYELIDTDSIGSYYDSLILNTETEIQMLSAGSKGYESYGYYRSGDLWALNSLGRQEKERLVDKSTLFKNNKEVALKEAQEQNRVIIQENDKVVNENTWTSWLISLFLEFFTFFMILLINSNSMKDSKQSIDTKELSQDIAKILEKTVLDVTLKHVLSVLNMYQKPQKSEGFGSMDDFVRIAEESAKTGEDEVDLQVYDNNENIIQNPVGIEEYTKKRGTPKTITKHDVPVKKQQTMRKTGSEKNTKDVETSVLKHNVETNADFSESPSNTSSSPISEGHGDNSSNVGEDAKDTENAYIEKHTEARKKNKLTIPFGYRFNASKDDADIVIDTSDGVDSLRN